MITSWLGCTRHSCNVHRSCRARSSLKGVCVDQTKACKIANLSAICRPVFSTHIQLLSFTLAATCFHNSAVPRSAAWFFCPLFSCNSREKLSVEHKIILNPQKQTKIKENVVLLVTTYARQAFSQHAEARKALRLILAGSWN